MAKVKLVLDTRRAKKDQSYPIYIRLTHNRESRNINTGYSASISEWLEKEREVRSSYPNSKRVNLSLSNKLVAAKRVIIDNENKLNFLTIDELKKLITSFNSESQTSNERTLQDFGEELISRLKKANRFGSAISYKGVLAIIKRFNNGKDVNLCDIDYKFLLNFEADCYGRGISTNGLASYLRHFRAIINIAISEGLIKQDQYPFKKYRIKREKTVKRAISKDDILKVINADIEENTRLWHCKNFFTFMFHTRGMNFIDIATLKMKDLQDGRIIYKRLKTGKLYNIKITPKAQEIIDFYTLDKNFQPEDYVFPIIPSDVIGDKEKERERVVDKRKYFNIDLKSIATLVGIKTNLTSYVIRHSWASIAKFSGVAPAVIGESLGHSDLKTTETYLAEFEHDILDKANDLIVS